MANEKMRLTQDQIWKFLVEITGDLTSEPVALRGGEWSSAFAFSAGGVELVSRFSPTIDDFVKDQYVNQFGSTDLPIPQTFQVGEAFGGYFAISERAFGTLLDELPSSAVARLAPSLLRTLDAMRTAEISESRGFGVWEGPGVGPYETWEDFLLNVDADEPGKRTSGWRNNLSTSPLGDTGFRSAHTVLAELAHDLPNTRSLVHNDLINLNVMASGSHVSAVFDWGFSMWGDFVYDLAKICFFEPIYDPVKGHNWVQMARHHYSAIGLDVPEFERRLRCCMIHIGLETQSYYASIRDWTSLEPVADRTSAVANLAL